jgi:hypothetical protein
MRFEDLLIVQPSMFRYSPAPPADAPHVLHARRSWFRAYAAASASQD